MIVSRFYEPALAQASYLIGCAATGEAIVIDPNRDVDRYIAAAAREGVAITHVTETHIHADFLSGTRELAARTGARLYLSDEGDQEWKYQFASEGTLVRHGDRITVGNVIIQVAATPGHTPEHLAFLVTDGAAADQPIAAVTGDFVFVGDVGRPDLLERAANMTGTMEKGARVLWNSLQAFKSHEDWLQIWPGHGAGSACGKSLGAVPQTTLGYELRANWAFQIDDEQEFVRAALADQPEPPAYFARMKRMNADGIPPMPSPPSGVALEERVRDGALVVDLRPSSEFLEHHLEGSISLPIGRSLLTSAGSVLDPARELVLLMPADALHEVDSVALDLALIGYDRILGALPAVDLESFAPRRVVSIPSTDVRELSARAEHATVVDVRSAAEWNEGHVPGAVHVPLALLTSQLSQLRTSQPIVTYCQTGARSATAASVLRAAGIADVSNADGGFDAWLRDARPAIAGQRR
jgi:hydroxyacylglutathione hydrolase